MLGIFEGFGVLADIITPIINFFTNGLKQLIDFIIRIPQIINDLIIIIPQPLNSIIFSFIGLFVVSVVFKAVK